MPRVSAHMGPMTASLRQHPLPVASTPDKRLGFGAGIDDHGDPVIRFAVNERAAFRYDSAGLTVQDPDATAYFDSKALAASPCTSTAPPSVSCS